MSSLQSSDNTARFFGLNISALWRDLLTAWSGMINWPVFSWLWPKLTVRLALPTGAYAASRDLNAPPLQNEKLARSARFNAVVLPENLLLRQTLTLPKLQAQELKAALDLEVQALSPFAPDDLVWAHETLAHGGATLHVSLVLTSRKRIAQHIAAAHASLSGAAPEVWVTHVNRPGYMVLAGFGEAKRLRQSKLWRWFSAVLALSALTVSIAIAATPTIQLYLRFLQANQAMSVLQQRAIPVLAQRESLVLASEQLTSLVDLGGKFVAPLQALKLITEALPDDTSLLNLQIQGLKVNISGQTANASELMKQLGNTPGLRDVKAPTPATKPLGAQRESFTIEFTLEPALLRSTP